jgi:hypothetical protein
MNKTIIACLIIGLLIATTACGNSKTTSPPITNQPTNTQQANTQTNTVQTGTPQTTTPQPDEISKIASLKVDTMLGKTFTVEGKVVSVTKTASISGYRLNDGTDTTGIGISTQNLPKVNSTMTVKGILQKSALVGYYLVAIE